MLNGKNLRSGQLTAANILDRVEDAAIFSRYICEVKSPTISPFREDKKPSCGFYTNSRGRLTLHDFALEQHWSCFDAVKEKYGLSFAKVLQLINKDFELGLGTSQPKEITISSTQTNEEKSKAEISFNVKPYTHFELEYWSDQGVSPEALVKFGVISASHVKFGQGGWKSTKNNPIFVYIFGQNRFKIYRPLNKDGYRWLDQTSGIGVCGIMQLPSKGRLLIITKSYKDVMTLYGLGFPAICPMSENVNIPPKIIRELKTRFTHIITLFDNDDTGKAAALRYDSIHDIPYMFIPKLIKDLSDMYGKYGKYKTHRILKKIIGVALSNKYEKFLLYRSYKRSKKQDSPAIGSLKDNSDDIPF